MPIQAPQWTDYLNCPVCCREFGPPPRSPISLGCGHTLCRHCLKQLHRKQCPFDQTVIQSEPEELVVNTALLQLAGYAPPAQPFHPPCIKALPEQDRQAYDVIVRGLEHLAIYLKLCGSASNSLLGSRLSRPMQRKLVTLLQCAMTDEEGRGRAARAARSLGERTVTELILQHQNPQQLSANLWAAVRARGCQFLGPAMQEEVLKLVLLALEDGSALSRKVLVMFVVQRLEPHFPQASKTSIGHVVQLLYRASCFKVSKRECDSSLMQLKEEFRTYESLRREHDAQIVQIATEAGLRIAPDQWSALLYGDTSHKSHMQSIIDKLQTPQSFAQSVQELFIALQRTGDPAQLIVMSMHLDRLASIDPSPDAKSPSWQQLAEVIMSIKEVVSGLVHYLQQQGRDSNHNQKHILPDHMEPATTGQTAPATAGGTPTHKKSNTPTCWDSVTRASCPRGSNCNLLHFDDDIDRWNNASEISTMSNGNNNPYAHMNGHHVPEGSQMNGHPLPGVAQMPIPPHVYRHPLAPMPAHEHLQMDNFNNMNNIPQMRAPALHRASPEPDYFENRSGERGVMNYAHMPPVNRVMIPHNEMASPTYSVQASSHMQAPPGINSPMVNGSAHSGGFAPMPRYALPIPFGYHNMMVPVSARFYHGAMAPNFRYPPPMYAYPRPYPPEAILVPVQRPPAPSPRAVEERASGAETLPEVQPFTNGLEARQRLFTNHPEARDRPFTSRLEARERPFTNSLEARERPSTSRVEPSERNVSPTWPQNPNVITFEELISAIGAFSDDDTELERQLLELERRMATMVENKNNE